MSRLIAVSNRVPDPREGPGSGGLAVALTSALKERGGLWFGWSGRKLEKPSDEASMIAMDGFTLGTLDLSPDEYEGYYAQHANQGLWPLCHGRLDLTHFDHHAHDSYHAVNRRFAGAIVPHLRAEDLIWVHDYHLVPLGSALRERGAKAPIGFFLHIPFPPPENLATLPWSRQLLHDLCAYDVVGFQTARCLHNFNQALQGYLGDPAERAKTVPHCHVGKADAYPISIDTRAFTKTARSEKVRRWGERLKGWRRQQSWAVGVERLDYTKGLAERFDALELLLQAKPEWQGRLTLIQIAAPSRESVQEYKEMQAELEAQTGRINARYGRLDWAPIRYLNRTYDHTRLAALFQVSRVGVVTPLRDGMNLVAKEYVAAQDPEDPGVLVLSEFAGAAEVLSDALLVNPYDTEATADALARALTMPLEERRRRWTGMMAYLERHDVYEWSARFLADLAAATPGPTGSEAAADRQATIS